MIFAGNVIWCVLFLKVTNIEDIWDIVLNAIISGDVHDFDGIKLSGTVKQD